MRILAEDRPGLRPEIQALRAVAVALVLAYHLWPYRLEGGFVGVDVFFVISGYLITAHICKPITAGSFRLRDFYSRRIRRLLPASLLVLLTVAVATWIFVPHALWSEFGHQIAASAFYFENWALATNAVDYSAPTADVSPVQHFWSLSVEEQFYLVWPMLLILSAVVGRRMRWTRAHFVTILGIVTVASFVCSLVLTADDPASAYFSTFTRAWEFGAGGLLAVIPLSQTLPDHVRAALSWVGLAAIGAAAVLLSAETPFPGWIAAIPVGGALLIMVSGMPATRWAPSMLVRLRPVQFLGDISYSLYLWHWPIIIFVPFILGRELDNSLRFGVVVVAIGLAYLTRRFVEKPFISGRTSTRRRDTTPATARSRPVAFAVVLSLAITGMVVVAAPATAMVAISGAQIAEAQDELADVLASPPPCFGSDAITDDCDPDGTDGAPVIPDPVLAVLDEFAETNPGCQGVSTEPMVLLVCYFGEKGSSTRIALVGDSHAAQWQPALESLAEKNDWELATYVRGGCPLTSAKLDTVSSVVESCAAWNADLMRELDGGQFDAVVVSARSSTPFEEVPGQTNEEVAAAGYHEVWSSITTGGTPVLVIRDNPDPVRGGVLDVPSCVEKFDRGPECVTDQDASVYHDPQVVAAEALDGVRVLDVTDLFCIDGECPAVIGDVLVYRLGQHVTATYAVTLDEEVELALLSLLQTG